MKSWYRRSPEMGTVKERHVAREGQRTLARDIVADDRLKLVHRLPPRHASAGL
jgi:hypothetical protein